MKRLIVLALLSVLLLTSCMHQPTITPIPDQNPSVGTATATDPCCLILSDAGTIASFYTFGTNCLKSRQMGEAYASETAPKSMTFSFGGKSYPMYYSVTTRPSGELNEVDAYRNSDSTIQLNLFQGTDTTAVFAFSNYLDGPIVTETPNQESLTQFVLSVLPDDFVLENYKAVYEGTEDLGHQLVLVRQVGGYDTIERITTLVAPPDGNLMEFRAENYGCFNDITADQILDRSVLEAAVSAQVNKSYRKAEVTPIESVKLTSATLGKDVGGEVYYSVCVEISYTNETTAPKTLDLLYFPSRLA